MLKAQPSCGLTCINIKEWRLAGQMVKVEIGLSTNGKKIRSFKVSETDSLITFSHTSGAMWTQYLEKLEIKISMDGKGRATDNIWIERFWKSFKNDFVYINPCDDGFELYGGAQNHIEYYNNKTHHTTKQKPNNRYKESINKKAA